jgi:hypothetical protein
VNSQGIRQRLLSEWVRKHIPLIVVVFSFAVIGTVTALLTHADASNVSVNFNSTVAVLPPDPIGTDISTYGSGLVTAPKQGTELANLGLTFMKVPIQYHNGTPVSSAGGDPNQNINGDQWVSAIKATGATPEIVIGGGPDDTPGNNGSNKTDDDDIFTASDAANLVKYFNTPGTSTYNPVEYWAIGNEPDGAGMSVSDYCTLFNAAATAMKAVDPTIKIDGPTFSFYSESSMQQFLNCAGSNVDVLDFHAYGTGGPTPLSDATLLSETSTDGQYLTQLRQMIDATDPTRASQIQMQVGELNLAWEYPDGYANTWSGTTTENNGSSLVNNDSRFFDPFNTVWGAATIGSVLEAGGRAMQYGDQNGGLGLTFDTSGNGTNGESMASTVNAHYASQGVDVSTYDPMPIYYGMGMFTGFSGTDSNSPVKFQGFGTNSVSATSSIANVDVFASSNNDDIVLVNKNPSTAETADVSLTGFAGGTADVWQTNDVNPYTYPTEIASGEAVTNSISVNLPAYSVTTIVLNGGSTTTTTTSPPTISGISSGTPTTSGATVAWTTNQASTSQVQYGTTTSYGASTTESSAMVTAHSVALTGLSASTTYHYRVVSTNSDNETSSSSDSTFTTAAATTTPTPPTNPSPPVTTGTTLTVPFRINVGGSSYKDSAGNTWLADTDSTGGAVDDQGAGKTIKDTSVQTIYQDERYGSSFSYRLPVTNGTYKLQLDFAEIYAACQKSGCRVFNVSIDGTPWLKNLDIAAKVGSYAALNESENVTVTSGDITIALTGVTGDAQLAGIEVTAPSTTTTPPPTSAATGAITGIASMCLDDEHAVFQNGNTVWLYTCNGTDAQKWTIPGDGTVRLDNNQYCLDAENSGTVPGTPAVLYGCNGSTGEQWVVSSNGSISNPHSGLCLDDKHSGTSNGNTVWLYTCNGTDAQKWTTPKA